MAAEIDYLAIMFPRKDVEGNDISSALEQLNYLISKREIIQRFHQRVDIGISGYDNDSRELFEIPEIRKYLQQIDSKFPYWFYFLNNLNASSIQLIVFSCIECKIQNGRLNFDQQSMLRFLNAHFTYMNQMCNLAGLGVEDNELLTKLVVNCLM